MEQDIVQELEERIEAAVAEILHKMGGQSLPLVPGRPTFHLMAKAAVTVYETAVANHPDGVIE